MLFAWDRLIGFRFSGVGWGPALQLYGLLLAWDRHIRFKFQGFGFMF